MPDQVTISGKIFSWDGNTFANTEVGVDPTALPFEKEPFHEQINPEMKAYKGKAVKLTSYVSITTPEFLKTMIGRMVTGVVDATRRLISWWRDENWEWVSERTYLATERIPVRWWFDKSVFRIEWVLVHQQDFSGLGFAPALIAPILGGVAAALFAVGFLVMVIKVSSEDLGKAVQRWPMVILLGLGIFVFFKFRQEEE